MVIECVSSAGGEWTHGHLSGKRLPHPEATALPWSAPDLDDGAMRAANRFDYRQSEAGTPLLAGPGVVDSEKALEHVRQGIVGDSDAIVGNVQNCLARLL
jgi:hypothetical protein